jgi:hypothetical protein
MGCLLRCVSPELALGRQPSSRLSGREHGRFPRVTGSAEMGPKACSRRQGVTHSGVSYSKYWRTWKTLDSRETPVVSITSQLGFLRLFPQVSRQDHHLGASQIGRRLSFMIMRLCARVASSQSTRMIRAPVSPTGNKLSRTNASRI